MTMKKLLTTCAIVLVTALGVVAPTQTAQADPVEDVCLFLGLGTGAAGLTKSLAKGASWLGLGATLGCYGYTRAKEVTPAESRAALKKSYKKYRKMSTLKKMDALGYSCRKRSSRGSGGTDRIAKAAGVQTIKVKGKKYDCRAIRD